MECDNKGGKIDIKIIVPVTVVHVSIVALLVLLACLFSKRYRARTPAFPVGNATAASDPWAFDPAAGSESPIRSEGGLFPDRPRHPQIHL